MKRINLEKTSANIKVYIETVSSIKEVADYLGLTLYSVYKWTYGACLPTIDNLVNLADILDVKIEDLLVVERVEDDSIY